MKIMYLFLFWLTVLFCPEIVYAQLVGQAKIDSLLKELSNIKEDTVGVNLLGTLSFEYRTINITEGIKYGNLGLELAQKLNWKIGAAQCYNSIASNYLRKSDLPQALEYYEKALKVNEEIGNKTGIASVIGNIGLIYRNQSNYSKALEYYNKALNMNEEIGYKRGISINLSNIGAIYESQSDNSKALEQYYRALKINEELGNKVEIVNFLGLIGNIYKGQSDYTKALIYYEKGLSLANDINHKPFLANFYGNIGAVYTDQTNYSKAIEYLFKALKINEQLNRKQNIANNSATLSRLYLFLNVYDRSIQYSEKALAIYKELNFKEGIASCLGTIGAAYSQLEDKRAIDYYFMALDVYKEINHKAGISSAKTHIAQLYESYKDYDNAFKFSFQSLKIAEESGYQKGIADNLSIIGLLYFNLTIDSVVSKVNISPDMIANRSDNLSKAVDYIDKTIALYRNYGEQRLLANYLNILSDIYYSKGDFKTAYEVYKEFKSIQDSSFSVESKRIIADLESKRELELKEKENQILFQDINLKNLSILQKNQKISLAEKEKQLQHLAFLKEQAERQEKENQLTIAETEKKLQFIRLEVMSKEAEQQDAEIKAKSLQRNLFILGVIISLILFLIAFTRFREKKKLSEELTQQKTEIEQQKSIVEGQKEILQEKNEQIYASIRYASTIQNAILPWDASLAKAFSDFMVFYKPKDIVSGDSYWFKEVDGVKFLAVIDCTGHGIPGSMLTVIASSVLDDAVLGKRFKNTGDILTYMNDKVTEVLNQRLKENEVRDGMEVALIAIHQHKIQFSGAGRPLYLNNGSFEILKTDRRGIAGRAEDDSYIYTSLEIERSDNLLLYLTTDGFADQMNEEGKKYSTRRFVALLESISEKPLSEQFEILNGEFAAHQGYKHQIDDITIVGLRI